MLTQCTLGFEVAHPHRSGQPEHFQVEDANDHLFRAQATDWQAGDGGGTPGMMEQKKWLAAAGASPKVAKCLVA